MELTPLLKLMAQKNASDLFVVAGKPPCLKVNGSIEAVTEARLTPEQTMALVTGAMTPKQAGEFEKTQECNFAIHHEDLGRFRVSAYVQRNSASMVIRRIGYAIPTVEELHLPLIIKDLAMTKRGLILFVGATGTGKSTSLAAMIRHRNQNSTDHIITIEDPLEFLHSHAGSIVSQREVGIDTESYEVALKNTLRQAPDVILIGEIRSRETMSHAIAFAETGHLCLSTLHANNANQALERIIHFFPEDMHAQLFMDLSLNLNAVIAQQLIQRSDGKGLFPAVEILIKTPLVSDLIRKGEVHKLKELMKQSREHGMQTFDQALFDLFKAGKITYEDALRSADSRNDLRLMIKLSDEIGKEGLASRGSTTLLLDDE